MKRRDFLKRAGIGVAASAAFGPVFAQGSPTVRWRMASSFPKSLDTIYGAAEVLADRVSALTGGRFQIRVYQAGEIVPGIPTPTGPPCPVSRTTASTRRPMASTVAA